MINCKCGGHYKSAKGEILVDHQRQTAGCSKCDGEILISDLNAMRNGAIVDPTPVNVLKQSVPDEHKDKLREGKIVINNPKGLRTLSDYGRGVR